jgi:hypothetical protein
LAGAKPSAVIVGFGSMDVYHSENFTHGQMNVTLRAVNFLAVTVAALGAQVAEAQQLWHAVPGFEYILVDQASMHRERPPPPARPLHLRPPDTTVDIKIDGQIYPKQDFWCVPRGEVQFNSWGTSWALIVWPPNTYPRDGRVTKAAMDAVEQVVCADLEVASPESGQS